MTRLFVLLYGLTSYALFLAVFLYSIGFVGNVAVPKSVDSGGTSPWPNALLADLALLALFAAQHSIMARPWFKRWWTRWVPRTIERSTYVLTASLCLAALFWQWQPLGGTVWEADAPLLRASLWALFAVGWAVVLLSTFMISHAHLFGVLQVWDHARGRAQRPLRFQTPGLYAHLRHPIMLGFLIAFWSTPRMTLGHLLFAGVTTLYILAALQLEERDLLSAFGDRYRQYRSRVPMLVPRFSARDRLRSAPMPEPGQDPPSSPGL